jgi:hypothetical protein
VFALIDEDSDGVLTWDELYTFDISHALVLYPNVFQERGPAQSGSEASVVVEKSVEEILSEPAGGEEGKEGKRTGQTEKCVRDGENNCDAPSNHDSAKWTSAEQTEVDREEL